jgi:hypothetical protein
MSVENIILVYLYAKPIIAEAVNYSRNWLIDISRKRDFSILIYQTYYSENWLIVKNVILIYLYAKPIII